MYSVFSNVSHVYRELVDKMPDYAPPTQFWCGENMVKIYNLKLCA